MSHQEEHERFIEYLGQITEAEGVPRIAARIFGLLLLSPEELSLDEIAEQLAVSRASVSTDARRMEGCGFLERVTRRGDRRDYYRIAPDHFVYAMERKAAMLDRFATVFAMGSELRGLDPVVQQRIVDCAQTYRLLSDKAIQDLEEIRKLFPPSAVASSPQTPAQLLACRLRTSASKGGAVSGTRKSSSRGAPRPKKSL